MNMLPLTNPIIAFRHWGLYVFLCTLLIVGKSEGWRLQVKLPHFELLPETGTAVISVAYLALWFSGISMVAEWSRIQTKTQVGTIAQLTAGAIFFLIGQYYFIISVIDVYKFVDVILTLDTLLILGTLLLGVISGFVIGTFISLLTLLRPREEQQRTQLPRTPIVVRSMRFASIIIFIIGAILSFIMSLAASSFLSDYWWSLYIGSMIVFALPGLSSFLSGSDKIASMKNATDMHDTLYMLYGNMSGSRMFRCNPLYVAAERGDEILVREYIARGHDPDRVGERGWTPLLIATAQGHENVVRYLLECGANPNVGNFLGRTPLMYAARYGNLEIVQTLLHYGADPNFTTLPIRSSQNHPLMTAAYNGHKEVVHTLINAGADLQITDSDGLSAEDHARQAGYGETATLLRIRRRQTEQDS